MHDIALLRVEQSLVFSDKINKILLASDEDVIEEGTSVSVTGWGLQESGSIHLNAVKKLDEEIAQSPHLSRLQLDRLAMH